ncbi:hypothetical protein EVAR_61005_1 [Eumeta japonica]|uniref:Secreted protein n=1 Tax=Eumeta variegata TaxID=151549 RepID=A0A4C1ZBQ7_EUMVA|nr:hypothetical protein EVAR_61005_1 [Eumeta japonica]
MGNSIFTILSIFFVPLWLPSADDIAAVGSLHGVRARSHYAADYSQKTNRARLRHYGAALPKSNLKSPLSSRSRQQVAVSIVWPIGAGAGAGK